MNNKIKICCLALSLAVCLIMTLIAKTEIKKQENEIFSRTSESPVGMTQVIVHTGTQWVIENNK